MKRILCLWLPGLEAAGGLAPTLADWQDPHAGRRALEAVARRCLRYSPLVGLEAAPAPTSLFVDLTGVAALFGGEAALAERIVRRTTVRRTAAGGLAVRAAVADTLGAAWAVTHFGKAEGGRGKAETAGGGGNNGGGHSVRQGWTSWEQGGASARLHIPRSANDH